MQDIDELELYEITRDMLIVSGLELSARNIIDRNSMVISGFKYDETENIVEMLENEGNIKKVNRYAFLNNYSLSPSKKWLH